jgi:hypothetical protein
MDRKDWLPNVLPQGQNIRTCGNHELLGRLESRMAETSVNREGSGYRFPTETARVFCFSD